MMYKRFFILLPVLVLILGCAKKVEVEEYEEYEEEEEYRTIEGGTTIEEDAEFEGLIDTDGDLVIKGAVRGTIKSTGTIIVESTGYVECDSMMGTDVIVKGNIHGNVHAIEEITVEETGIIVGLTYCKNLVVNGGSVFEAKSDMGGYKGKRKK